MQSDRSFDAAVQEAADARDGLKIFRRADDELTFKELLADTHHASKASEAGWQDWR
jgi:hypothetical protein